jgi:ubiquinone/menaquinone biosynthesis C-methylase UbiE
MTSTELDAFVESHLDLQVRISYPEHQAFLIRHGLNQCSQILDVGCGNGTFVARLALDHPHIHFTGIDKRKQCIESGLTRSKDNLEFLQVDMFTRFSKFDFSRFDGVLMRYFLLHVDNAQKILELFKLKSKRPSRFWIIDLDWSQLSCTPPNENFDKLTNLVQDFCAKISVQTRGGQNVVPLLQKLEYHNIAVEHLPFSSRIIDINDFAIYLKQEVQCYSKMSGKPIHDPEIAQILQFIDRDVRSGRHEISYTMILISAELV